MYLTKFQKNRWIGVSKGLGKADVKRAIFKACGNKLVLLDSIVTNVTGCGILFFYFLSRAWIGWNSTKRGTIEPFATNLPGFVGNIRRSPRNTYWVGLSRARHSSKPSILDIYGNQPRLRGALLGVCVLYVILSSSMYCLIYLITKLVWEVVIYLTG